MNQGRRNQARAEIRQATIGDLDSIVPLFDAYRQYYRQPSDVAGARQFLLDRFSHNQSILFLAFADAAAAGFAQLYPSFPSGAMRRVFILNDLFVTPNARRHGIALALLEAAVEYGRRADAARLVLSTEIGNTAAQALYEKTGWKQGRSFLRVSPDTLRDRSENGFAELK